MLTTNVNRLGVLGLVCCLPFKSRLRTNENATGQSIRAYGLRPIFKVKASGFT